MDGRRESFDKRIRGFAEAPRPEFCRASVIVFQQGGATRPRAGGCRSTSEGEQPERSRAIITNVKFLERAARALGVSELHKEPRALLLPDFCNVPAVGVAIICGELLVFVLTLGTGEWDWVRFALTSLYVQWIVLISIGLLCALRGVLVNLALAEGAIICYLVVVSVTLLVSAGASQMMNPDGLRLWDVLSHVAISAIVTGMVLRYFYVQQRLRNQEQSELQSRIQALQSRIRPHFLFNSMNIIASLISIEPETAETVVEDLSELFRASLNDAGNQVPLDEELALCERYIRIESLRLGDRLQVEWDLGERPAALKIPLLTLQPLLENSIYHGIQPLPEGGLIRVQLRYVDGVVTIEVVNPVPPPSYRDRAHKQGNRMAINNIRSRLNVLYGAAAQLSTNSTDDQFVTRLSYPYSAPAEESAA